MAEPSAIERDVQQLAAELRRLETEYNLFFAGRAPRPPVETRRRVEAIIRRCDRGQFDTLAQRFRFNTLQARFSTFAELWDRALRAREEGRPGPFNWRAGGSGGPPPEDPAGRVVHAASFVDPAAEMDKLEALYASVSEARRETGEDPVPFHRFAELVRQQVRTLRDAGAPEVAFRVSVKDGKVNLTVRGLRTEENS